MDITGTLAKLLATENLSVVHNASASTAAFDVQNRVLTLPVLNDASQEVMTMFAAHEVGHALQTPQNWTDLVIKGTPFDYVNVIEDVRIEKFIQDKFPGLKRDFSRGYGELNDRDFFQIADEDINKMSLIDRINLHFKLGYRAVVEFSAEEMQWVHAIDDCETFQQVCLVAKMMSDWEDEQQQDKEEDDTQEPQQSDGAGAEEGENQSSDDEQPEEQEKEDFGSKGRKGDEEQQEESSDGQPQTAEGENKVSQTQQAMERNQKELAKNFGGQKHTTMSIDTNIDGIITIEELRKSFTHETQGYDWVETAAEQLAKFLLSTKKEVNHMVQRFEMKKAADAYARASVNKTGVLNTSRLHQYKLTDDIFLRQTVTRDGKSHGMVMYVDWSGSMSNIILDTVKQVITLVQFCQKVQIPFEVYSFTTGNNKSDLYNEASYINEATVANNAVQLVQVLTSTAKKNDLKQDILNIFTQALYLGSNYRVTGTVSTLLGLGGTPLDNALTMVPAIIDRFRSNTGAQRVSFVALTDGESSPLTFFNGHGTYGYAYSEQPYLKFGNCSYKVNSEWDEYDTVGIIDILKKVTTDVTFTNIYLGSKKSSEYHAKKSGIGKVDLKTSNWNKNNGAYFTPKHGWDLLSCLNANSFNKQQEDIEVETGAKKGQIRTALKKFLKAQSTAKVILDEMVEQFA